MLKENKIYNEDGIKFIKYIEDKKIDLILSDIPYGISYEEWDILHSNKNSALGGASASQIKLGNGFAKRGKPLNGWSKADRNISKEYQNFIESFADEWLRVLKPGASCFVFAGRRLAHRAVIAFEDAGFVFKDMIGWNKKNAILKAQQISKVYERRKDLGSAEKYKEWRVGNLRPVFEPVLWFMKPYKIGGTISDNMIENGVGVI